MRSRYQRRQLRRAGPAHCVRAARGGTGKGRDRRECRPSGRGKRTWRRTRAEEGGMHHVPRSQCAIDDATATRLSTTSRPNTSTKAIDPRREYRIPPLSMSIMPKRSLRSPSPFASKKPRSDVDIVHRKIATADAAAKVDAHRPLPQLLNALSNVVKSPKKGEAVVYWMRMEDMRSESFRQLAIWCEHADTFCSRR